MKDKQLIVSFFLANLVDAISTSLLLTQEGWQELNGLALQKIQMGELHELIIIKLALTAVLIGSYALARSLNSRLEYPLEQSLRLGGLVVWGVQIWNAFNIVATYL